MTHTQTYEFEHSTQEFEATLQFDATNETYDTDTESIDWDSLVIVSVKWYADSRFEDVQIGDVVPETLKDIILEEIEQDDWPDGAYVA